ncbi:MAG: hypothetical protein LBB41_00190 [Prevotellaceae bacterium]|jgi:hypothetical protein|nr:hypothetical protein [Prevotellaceae bacterium]
MQITVLQHQSLLDIAIQQYGDATAAFDIALANDLPLDAELAPGQKLTMPAALQYGTADRTAAGYYATRHLHPATAITDGDDGQGVFDDNFNVIFE